MSLIFKEKKGKFILSVEKQLSIHEIVELWAVWEELNVECTKYSWIIKHLHMN